LWAAHSVFCAPRTGFLQIPPHNGPLALGYVRGTIKPALATLTHYTAPMPGVQPKPKGPRKFESLLCYVQSPILFFICE